VSGRTRKESAIKERGNPKTQIQRPNLGHPQLFPVLGNEDEGLYSVLYVNRIGKLYPGHPPAGFSRGWIETGEFHCGGKCKGQAAGG